MVFVTEHWNHLRYSILFLVLICLQASSIFANEHGEQEQTLSKRNIDGSSSFTPRELEYYLRLINILKAKSPKEEFANKVMLRGIGTELTSANDDEPIELGYYRTVLHPFAAKGKPSIHSASLIQHGQFDRNDGLPIMTSKLSFPFSSKGLEVEVPRKAFIKKPKSYLNNVGNPFGRHLNWLYNRNLFAFH